ncbi:DUF1707 domain-containing protein [Tessaracoccus rhinocerotis]|uniref:DUF1707 domain-containing protein n=1 Tax=Tessaracoccus rhinocerotis TaxID=1689449 RepID=A0A553K5B2_9ACTN|nr:DUF1707 domain-containing protein [Tessaracoccus rhinocerotis]TRY19895.1 DUF1707 domain-containing protein [Tessaracoccus rhinocerotis]
MTSLPPSSKYLQRPDEPVEEQERESITQRLSDAYADGRMSQDDYMSSLDVVYAARSLGELVPVVEKLPAAADNTPAIVSAGSAPAGEVTQSRNVLVPTMMAAGGVLVLLFVLGVLAVLIF